MREGKREMTVDVMKAANHVIRVQDKLERWVLEGGWVGTGMGEGGGPREGKDGAGERGRDGQIRG